MSNSEKQSILRKIPGFRSGTTWKMILAVFGYGLIFLIILGMILPESEVADTPSAVQPQVTPVVTLTMVDTTRAQEQAYIENMTEIIGELNEALAKLSTLSGSYERSTEWNIDAGVQVAYIRYYCEEIQKITPPARYKTAHGVYVDATEKILLSMDYLVSGVDTVDANKINQAAVLMDEASVLITEATSLYQKS